MHLDLIKLWRSLRRYALGHRGYFFFRKTVGLGVGKTPVSVTKAGVEPISLLKQCNGVVGTPDSIVNVGQRYF